MGYAGPERRKALRLKDRFVVAYRVLEEASKAERSQTKNIGLGGMLLTTNRKFFAGTKLALEIRLPFDPDPIMLIGNVLESKEVIANLIYDTRMAFLAVDKKHQEAIGKTVNYYLKRKGETGN